MNNLIKNLKPNPYLITILFIILTALIAYSVSIKKEVQVKFYNDFFIFKAND